MKLSILFFTFTIILTGCATAHFTKTGDFQANPRSPNCDFSIFTVPPTTPYKEVGLIDFIVSGPDQARKSGQELVCKAGGDGLILSGYTDKWVYTKGTVILIQR